MSVRIFIKDNVILHVKNSIFDALHNSIISITEENEIKLPTSISSMLHNMNQDVFGRGLVSTDITEFIKIKNDLMLFTELIKLAIEQEQKSKYPLFLKLNKYYGTFIKLFLIMAKH